MLFCVTLQSVPYLNLAGANEIEAAKEVQEKFFSGVPIEVPSYALHKKVKHKKVFS